MNRREVIHIASDWLVPILLIVMIPVLATFYVLDANAKSRLTKAQEQSCERGNTMRSAFNLHISKQKDLYAEAVRVLSLTGTTVTSDRLEELLRDAARGIALLPIVDCERIVRKP